MPFNGSGIFIPAITFVDNTLATAEDQNTQDVDFAAGLTDCVTRDGQSPATANISMGGFKLTNLGSGTASTDAVSLGQIGSVNPSGEIIIFAGTSIPNGFLLCNGTAVSRSTYANLFTAIGTLWGSGDGSTTFNLPNLTGTVPAGVDPTSSKLSGFTTIGNSGGAQNVTLSTAQLPAHSHAITDPGHAHGVTDPTHNHTVVGIGGFATTVGGALALGAGSGGSVQTATAAAATGISINGATTGITTQNTGSGTPTSIVQPTAAVNYLIRI